MAFRVDLIWFVLHVIVKARWIAGALACSTAALAVASVAAVALVATIEADSKGDGLNAAST